MSEPKEGQGQGGNLNPSTWERLTDEEREYFSFQCGGHIVCAKCGNPIHPVHGDKRNLDTIAALRAEVAAGEEEIEALQKKTNHPCGDALDKLWKEVLIRRKPSYGDWEYPGEAYRHLKAEFEEIEAEVERLKGGRFRAVAEELVRWANRSESLGPTLDFDEAGDCAELLDSAVRMARRVFEELGEEPPK
jgi:cell division protein FtsB